MSELDRDSLICLGCACCCEDAIARNGQRMQATESISCNKRDAWIADQKSFSGNCNIAGNECTLEDAIAEIAAQLNIAKAPVFCGWASLVTENQRRVVQLAQRSGGYLDWTTSNHQIDSILSLQRVGHVGCTFGEIKNRADLMVYWNCDPSCSAPRFVERFVRTDNIIQLNIVEPDQLEFLTAIKLQLFDSDMNGAPSQAGELIDSIRKSSYCVIVIDSDSSQIDSVEHEQLTKLVMRLNRETQVRLVDLAFDNNSKGAVNVQTWLTGYPASARCLRSTSREGDFRFDPYLWSTQKLIASSSIDLVVVIGDLPEDVRFNNSVISNQIPRIEIGACRCDSKSCLVQIPVQSDFLNSGTIFRGDGVPLPLRPRPDRQQKNFSPSNSEIRLMNTVTDLISKNVIN